MKKELHHFGLVRFSKKTGKIDKSMTALGCGMIQLWALQNTTKTKASVILDLDDGTIFAEYIGTADGFPEIHKTQETFVYEIPCELFEIMSEDAANREAGA